MKWTPRMPVWWKRSILSHTMTSLYHLDMLVLKFFLAMHLFKSKPVPSSDLFWLLAKLTIVSSRSRCDAFSNPTLEVLGPDRHGKYWIFAWCCEETSRGCLEDASNWEGQTTYSCYCFHYLIRIQRFKEEPQTSFTHCATKILSRQSLNSWLSFWSIRITTFAKNLFWRLQFWQRNMFQFTLGTSTWCSDWSKSLAIMFLSKFGSVWFRSFAEARYLVLIICR